MIRRRLFRFERLFKKKMRPRRLKGLRETSEQTHEMYDIFEGGYVCSRKTPFFDDVLAKNIKELLVRDGKIRETDEIVFPAGALSEVDYENETYQYDFEVFRGPEQIIYYGTAYGSCRIDDSEYRRTGDPCDVYVEIIDLTVEVAKPY